MSKDGVCAGEGGGSFFPFWTNRTESVAEDHLGLLILLPHLPKAGVIDVSHHTPFLCAGVELRAACVLGRQAVEPPPTPQMGLFMAYTRS